MSSIKYGLISETDARCLEKTIDLICLQNPGQVINVTEIGLYSGETSKGIQEYISSKGYGSTSMRPNDTMRFNNFKYFYTGIDNFKDQQPLQKEIHYDKLIQGNSNEVYNQIEDNSQHLIFVDGLHTFAAIVADFFCYAPKVKVGGYLAFHDCGKHIDPLSGWQGVGDKNDPDMCLGGVNKAIETLGLPRKNYVSHISENEQWQLIFDEADILDTGGGICVFKKLY